MAFDYACRNPFLFRGPIPTIMENILFCFLTRRRNPFLFRGPIPTPQRHKVVFTGEPLVAIPSYSEVLFLLIVAILFILAILCRNPFLFRGPIPTERG